MLVIALKLGHFFQMIPNVSEPEIVMAAAYLLPKHKISEFSYKNSVIRL